MAKLKKDLGFIDVFAISAGAMISSGLFVLPGLAYKEAGPAMVLGYALAGLLYLPAMLNYAELSTAMPRAGGSYFYIDRSMGPILGAIGGISLWLSIILKSVFALVGIGAFSTLIFPGFTDLHIKLISLAFLLIFLLLNVKGVKEAGKMQIIMVAGLLTILTVYIVEGFLYIEPEYFKPFVPFGRVSIVSTAAFVYISFAGLTIIAEMGEEIKNPGKNIPLGMFAAYIVIMTVYLLSVLVTTGLVPPEKLAGSLTPLAQGAEIAIGETGMVFISIAALMAFATTANAGIMAASRVPVSMSRDDHLPEFLQHIHPKFKTPVTSILITSSVMAAIIILAVSYTHLTLPTIYSV